MGSVCSVCVGGYTMPRAQSEFLSLTRFDVAQLSLTFRSLRREGKSGFVNVSSVLKFFKMENNELMRNAFLLLNRGEDKDLPVLSFQEFVHLTWNLGSCDNLAYFAFSLYDMDRQNDLTADEADDICRDLCGNDKFPSLKEFVPMKFTGIDYSHFSLYLNAHPDMMNKLKSFQEIVQVKTLGKARWQAIAQKRKQMSRSSTFIDLFEVLKLLAVKTGSKRHFLAISRHFIVQDEKQKNKRSTMQATAISKTESVQSDFQLSGYSEPMRRWIKEKNNASIKQTYHPVYSHSPDYDEEKEGERSHRDVDALTLSSYKSHSVADSTSSSKGRLERKLRRQNSKKSQSSFDLDNPTDTDKSARTATRRKSLTRQSSKKVAVLAIDADDSDSIDSEDLNLLK